MADENYNGTAPEELDAELKASMGSYFNNSVRVPGDAFQPPKAPVPKKPGDLAHQQGGTGKGTKPPFPIVPADQLHLYKNVKQTDEDTFGFQKTGTFDKELNELALQDIAAQRGITVEQLLKSEADRKAALKLKPSEESMQQSEPLSSFVPDISEEQELEALQKRMNELKANKADRDLGISLVEKQKQADQQRYLKKMETEKPGVPKEYRDNPVIERLRKKLSLDEVAPATIQVEDISFELLPPSASMNLWILEKIQAGQVLAGDGLPLQLTIKIATVSAALTKIEGISVEEALGVTGIDDDLGRKIVAAQTLWEMFIGIPSREELFRFHPDVPLKLYECFKKTFGEKDLKTDLADDVHRYVCPVEGCLELYDMREPSSGVVPFCKLHGVPTEDKGLVKGLRSVPLA